MSDGSDQGDDVDPVDIDPADIVPDTDVDAADAAGIAPVPEAGSNRSFEPDADKRAFLREIAEEVRGDSSESDQIAAILYQVSDLYDPTEDTAPEDIYLNVRRIMQVKEQGGIDR